VPALMARGWPAKAWAARRSLWCVGEDKGIAYILHIASGR